MFIMPENRKTYKYYFKYHYYKKKQKIILFAYKYYKCKFVLTKLEIDCFYFTCILK